MCAAAVGDVNHRLYGCGHLMECEGAELSNALRAKGARADADDPFWNRLFPIGPPIASMVEDAKLEFIGEEGSVTGEVFGDGSVLGRGAMRRGGSAFGVLRSVSEQEIGEMGDLALRGAWVKLEGEDHSSTDAELNALESLLTVAVPPVHFITDCMAIVRGIASGGEATTRPSNFHADWWYRIWGYLRWWEPGSFSVSHVKAHRKREAVGEDEGAVRWWHGNRLVDIWAGVASKENDWDAQSKRREAKAKKEYLELAVWAGKVLKTCAEQKPWAKEGRRWKVVGEDSGSAVSKVPRHELEKAGGKMKCLHCPQSASTVAAAKRLRSLPCWGPIANRVAGFARKKGKHEEAVGHLLRISYPVRGDNEEGVIWCTICGAYAVFVARNLLKECRGEATRAGRVAIRRLSNLWHPRRAERMEAPIPYLPERVQDLGASEFGTEGRRAFQEESGGGEVGAAAGARGDGDEGRADDAGGGAVEPLELEAGLAVAGGYGVGRGQRLGGGAGPVSMRAAEHGGGGGDAPRFTWGGVDIGSNIGNMLVQPYNSGSNKRSRFRF